MERLIAPSGIKIGIFRCLKSGVNPEFPEQGTPQGGVVSPLLANIALDGIEDIHQSVRYADDMVFILKPKDNAVAILEQISQFLAERGMKVSEKKTKLTATTDGFDFLGWHVNVKGEKSPYDGDIAYWSERNSKLYDGYTSKALKRQNHSCGHCGLKMLSDEKVHLHHVDGNHENWKKNNLLAVHESCHDYIHMSKHEN
jgi:5-methylcytosine-specific restriction endonuclease McrA